MKKSPLKKMSKNKALEMAKYWPLRRQFLSDNQFCEFYAQNDDNFAVTCLNHSTQIHHSKGQNWRIMNDTRWWIAICTEHHRWIEDNKKEARQRGLILYK